APVTLERLEGHLDPRRHADEPIRARADGHFLEALVTDLLDVLARNDPARARRGGPVERQEIRPRLLEDEANPSRVDDADLLHAVLEEPGRAAAIALERELHVVRGDGIPVVESHAVPDDEGVREAGLGAARSTR